MESFPRQAAATGQFRHGVPRNFRATEAAVYFLRSGGSRDSALRLHRWDRATGQTQELLSPDRTGDLTPAERALRERLRESASGITSYDVRADRVVAGSGGVLRTWDATHGARTLDVADGRVRPPTQPRRRVDQLGRRRRTAGLPVQW